MVVWQAAVAEGASAFDVVALTFAGTLLSLAVLEHWFLVLPLPSEQLWNWGLKSRQRGGHDSLRVAEPRPATIAIPSAVVRPPR
jgi:hypothetical protein